MKASFLLGGGLGDCIWQYFTDEPFRKLLSVKEKHNIVATCYVHSCNSESIELLRYNPHIQDIYKEPYRQYVPRPIPPLDQLLNLAEFPDQPMPLYLSPEEEAIAEQIASYGEFVVLHPFAGEPHRSFADYSPLIIEEILKRGLKVVVIGGNHSREETNQEETFEHYSPCVFSLVNKVGVRLSCELVRRAKYFLGSHSCFQMASWAYGTPSLCIVPDAIMTYLMYDELGRTANPSPYVTHLFKERHKMMFFSQLPHISRFLEFFDERRPDQHPQGRSNPSTDFRVGRKSGPRPMLVLPRSLRENR